MRLVVSAAVAALAFSAVPAEAAVRFYAFTGTVTDSTIAGVEVGQTFNARIVADDLASGTGDSVIFTGTGSGSFTTNTFDRSFNGLSMYSFPFDRGQGAINNRYELFTAFDIRPSASFAADVNAATNVARGGVSFEGLGRISFVGVAAAVPEPATWAMMIAGFGLVGGAVRRRQSALA